MTQPPAHTPSIFTQIRAMYPQLSAKEQQIADYMFEHPGDIIHHSITELADLCECAEATIFRLCRRLGFRGYQAFKIALASEVVPPKQSIHQEIDLEGEGDLLVLSERIFAANQETLRDTQQIMSRDTLQKAVDALVQANRIEFYGSGGSAAIAQDAYHKFMRTGIPCQHHSDAHYQVMAASMLKAGDVVVAISHSGATKDVIEAVKVAKEAGATIIAITGYGKSPLSKLADVCLFTVSRETQFRTEALSSRLAQLSIIDLFYVAVSLKREEQTTQNIKKIREAISFKRL
ncbi:MurR/RpiR family transcriptional regulator [Brevibacillus dissolubilis]|uniref:MurR/RpiR family transcriptional regulator n=1 Tax=Brevibacillus dissolubilis TaxID=1844116 RepID=UPI00210051E9|nr:MurR/RpiR family transcriptional regulator [Brevibacillus dissolubilis]